MDYNGAHIFCTDCFGRIMKPKINKISFFSSLFILFLISIPGFYAYYFTDWRNEKSFQDADRRRAYTEFQEDSRIFDDRILLRKDKSLVVDKNRLVFKGVKDNVVHLDVYLLELDPESAYPHYISKADADKQIRIGDSTFEVLKVNKRTLQLKILDRYES